MFSDATTDGLGVTEYKSKATLLKANLGWVYAANQVIADDCSAVRLKLMRRMPDGDEEEVFKHEVLDLLFNPNNIITSKQMWNLYFQYLNLTGEAYIIKLDRQGNPLTDNHKLPTALLPLPSHLCEFRLPLDDNFDHSTVNFAGSDYPIQAFLRDTNPNLETPYCHIPGYVAPLNKHDCGIIREYRNYFY